MRRRPVRTALTVVTVIFLTFTILTFVSFQTEKGINRYAAGTSDPATRFLIHRKVWKSMDRQALADLVYPVVLLHIAVFLFPFAEFFTSGNLFRYIGKTFGVLVPIYVLVGLLIFVLQSRHGETWRAMVEHLLGMVPVLGNARRSLALARLSAALEACRHDCRQVGRCDQARATPASAFSVPDASRPRVQRAAPGRRWLTRRPAGVDRRSVNYMPA